MSRSGTFHSCFLIPHHFVMSLILPCSSAGAANFKVGNSNFSCMSIRLVKLTNSSEDAGERNSVPKNCQVERKLDSLTAS